jgi:hypothetical protein
MSENNQKESIPSLSEFKQKEKIHELERELETLKDKYKDWNPVMIEEFEDLRNNYKESVQLNIHFEQKLRELSRLA